MIDFVLAEKLGKTLGEIRAMPNAEVVEWAAYLTWKAAQEKLAADVAERRSH